MDRDQGTSGNAPSTPSQKPRVKVDRWVAPQALDEDDDSTHEEADQSVGEPTTTIRPQTFADYPGQSQAKANLKVYVDAARRRRAPLDHVLLHGPPGLGKTTLAHIIANEMGATFYHTSGPAIDKPGDLAGLLAGIESGGLLFIDEIHRLSIAVEEVLYAAMEDFAMDIVVGQGPTARTVRMPLPPFTLVGATTRVAMLSAPLISRFGIQEHLDFYDDEALTTILLRSASIWGISLDPTGAVELARRSRGTPRIANRLLRRVRDFAEHLGESVISAAVVDHALQRLSIDGRGLDRMDRLILATVSERYDGGPVGLDTLAATIGEERSTLEEVYEPFLVHQGLLARGPRGRSLTSLGAIHVASGTKAP